MTRLRAIVQNSKYVTQVQQQRPDSPTVTLTWHACKYKVHKPSPGMRVNTRYINFTRDTSSNVVHPLMPRVDTFVTNFVDEQGFVIKVSTRGNRRRRAHPDSVLFMRTFSGSGPNLTMCRASKPTVVAEQCQPSGCSRCHSKIPE